MQKLRRLAMVRARIEQLSELQSAGRQLDFALAREKAEEQRLRNWIDGHRHEEARGTAAGGSVPR